MKRRISLTIVAAFTVFMSSLISSDNTTNAQTQLRSIADTGFITPGPDQKLRIMAEWTSRSAVIVRFRRIDYDAGNCGGTACKHAIASQTTSDPITLMPGEAASFDIPASFMGGVFVGVRGMVLSNDRNARVTAQIIDTITGKVVAITEQEGNNSREQAN